MDGWLTEKIMLIKDVPKDAELTIEVSISGRKLEFKSQCIETGMNYMHAEPIRIDGKRISFEASVALSVSLVYIREDKNPVLWRGVGISTVHENGRAMYKITTAMEGYEMNRRQAFRLFLGLGGVAQIGINKKAINVIVKDISENGFAFVGNEDMEVNKTPVRLVFKDMDETISLMGLVVRKIVVNEKKIIYGCSLTSANTDVTHYINEKQRYYLSTARNVQINANRAAIRKALKEPSNHINDSSRQDKEKKNSGKNKGKRN